MSDEARLEWFKKQYPHLPTPDLFSMESHKGIELDADPFGVTLKPNSPWGMVIYRTCYDDEAAWQKIRAEICDVESSFSADYRYLVDLHKPVFMDDKARFDGLDRVKIRDHFREWSKAEFERNRKEPEPSQPKPPKVYYPPHYPRFESLWNHCGLRYNAFGIVDDVCMESVHRGMPLFMLMNIDWKPMPPPTEEEIHQEQYHTDWDEGFMVDHSEGPGGWIYTETSRYQEYYDSLDSSDVWEEDFMFNYPSQVYGEMGLDKSPGFWRKEIAVRKAKQNNPESNKN